MENGLEPDQMVTCYLVHLIGCALSNREPEVLPDGLSWEDVVSRARDNSVLGLIWHAARWLDGIPGGVRESCQRFSDMVALEVFYILTLLLFEFTLFLFSQSLVFLFFLFSAPSVIDYSE